MRGSRSSSRAWVAAAGLVLAGCGPKPFPDDFLFGASMAGFQVDMGCPTLAPEKCEDRHSDWYQLITSSAELQDLKDIVTFEPPSHGPGHWELYEQDFERAKADMGLTGIRTSIEWSRVFPTATDGLEGDALRAVADPDALATYHAMFAAMKARGQPPLVTLNHYSLPTWIHDGVACHQNLATCTKRGWLDKQRTITEIAKFAGFAAKEFGGEVDLWATENEPFAVLFPGYVLPSKDRVNPPALAGKYDEAKQVLVALIEAHARMYDAVKANDTVDADKNGKPAEVGLVYSMTPVKGKTDSKVDQRAATHVFYLYNLAFLDGVVKGLVDADFDGTPDGPPRDDLVNRMDWIGINYYSRVTVEGTGAPTLPTLSSISDFNPLTIEPWEDYPKGIYEMAMTVKDRYGLPSFITETGTDITTDEAAGASWLTRYMTWTKRAIRDGAKVRGFFYWSLFDNYEWNHGMSMHFGLYAVSPTDPAKTRTARPAVGAYRQITKARDVPDSLARQYPAPE